MLNFDLDIHRPALWLCVSVQIQQIKPEDNCR